MGELPLSSRCVNEKMITSQTCDDCQVSLCLYYMLIAVSCLHCPDATVSMSFQLTICVQHMHTMIYLLSLISPLLFAVEIPLPFINCFGSVLVLTDPDQLGVTGMPSGNFLTETYGTLTAMVQARPRCAISPEPLLFAQVERPHLKLN